MKMNTLDKVAYTLLVVGGLNWGLVALGYNLVDSVFGADSMLAKLVYILVGLSALYGVYTIVTMMSKKSAPSNPA